MNFQSFSDSFNATSSRKTLKSLKLDEPDVAIYNWFKQNRAEAQPISGPLLCEKALWFHKQMKLEQLFFASQGWLNKFKARHEEDGDLKQFYKKWSIKDAILSSADSWDDIPARTIQRSWNKLYPVEVEDIVKETEGSASQESSTLLNIIQDFDAFQNVDKENIENGYQEALESDQPSDNTDVSDKEEPLEKVSPDEALKSADCLK
ncbi:Tc5 transposase DNA-binding domain [Popillia japonica]|uniref:Tc5 transposase DNA-binding domain n=1 Tax=Popillia japonica TaxID=7064 RepID=A0AAW1JB90_POPJA